VITMKDFHKIRKLRRQNLSHSEIARRLGINRKTVSKYLKSQIPPSYPDRSGQGRQGLFETYKMTVKSWLEKTPALSAREIFELLIEEGYRGSESCYVVLSFKRS
jgi:transcriptional regulator with XRE-family HTH domain